MRLILISCCLIELSLAGLPSLLSGSDGYLIKEYVNAITAYGPGLGVFTPYSYVDISYDNIPFVGKIPIFGKEGTSSRLGISPFYPPEGNPSNPFPPLYRARPLPLHVPEPQDVVAVPLDEEALHGEPLFPPELVLPEEEEKKPQLEDLDLDLVPPSNPFSGSESLKGNTVNWPTTSAENSESDDIAVDSVKEKNVMNPKDVIPSPSVDTKPIGFLSRPKRIFY